jgi:hypothetical protein
MAWQMTETWSDLEVFWTAASLVMLPAACYGFWDACHDLRAAYQRQTADRLIAAWWWFSAQLLFVLLFLGFALLGVIAGHQPPRPVQIGVVNTVASNLSAYVLLVVGGLAALCLLAGLWSRHRLRVLLEERHRVRDAARDRGRDAVRDPARDIARDIEHDKESSG